MSITWSVRCPEAALVTVRLVSAGVPRAGIDLGVIADGGDPRQSDDRGGRAEEGPELAALPHHLQDGVEQRQREDDKEEPAERAAERRCLMRARTVAMVATDVATASPANTQKVDRAVAQGARLQLALGLERDPGRAVGDDEEQPRHARQAGNTG